MGSKALSFGFRVCVRSFRFSVAEVRLQNLDFASGLASSAFQYRDSDWGGFCVQAFGV